MVKLEVNEDWSLGTLETLKYKKECELKHLLEDIADLQEKINEKKIGGNEIG